MITRQADSGNRYAARHVSRVGMIDCVGWRNPEAEAKLLAALKMSRFASLVRSLRQPPDEPDETCWLAGEGWWLSTAPV
jgi:protein-L-isoaspartate(D-aspartate) O-methyltransferase